MFNGTVMNLKVAMNTSSCSIRNTLAKRGSDGCLTCSYLYTAPRETTSYKAHVTTTPDITISLLPAQFILPPSWCSQHRSLDWTLGLAIGLHQSVSRLTNHTFCLFSQKRCYFFLCSYGIFFGPKESRSNILLYSFCVRWPLFSITLHEEPPHCHLLHHKNSLWFWELSLLYHSNTLISLRFKEELHTINSRD